jgi:hypothetical protein
MEVVREKCPLWLALLAHGGIQPFVGFYGNRHVPEFVGIVTREVIRGLRCSSLWKHPDLAGMEQVDSADEFLVLGAAVRFLAFHLVDGGFDLDKEVGGFSGNVCLVARGEFGECRIRGQRFLGLGSRLEGGGLRMKERGGCECCADDECGSFYHGLLWCGWSGCFFRRRGYLYCEVENTQQNSCILIHIFLVAGLVGLSRGDFAHIGDSDSDSGSLMDFDGGRCPYNGSDMLRP